MNNISHLDHIAIAVHSINEAKAFYEQTLGLEISHIEEMPSRGIKTAFLQIGQTKIELIEPLHDSSEISSFLAKRGPGIHHLAFFCQDLNKACEKAKAQGAKLIYESPQEGAHKTQVNFVHPKSSFGALVELVSK